MFFVNNFCCYCEIYLIFLFHIFYLHMASIKKCYWFLSYRWFIPYCEQAPYIPESKILASRKGERKKSMKIHVWRQEVLQEAKRRRELPGALESNFITSSFPLNFRNRIILILAYRPAILSSLTGSTSRLYLDPVTCQHLSTTSLIQAVSYDFQLICHIQHSTGAVCPIKSILLACNSSTQNCILYPPLIQIRGQSVYCCSQDSPWAGTPFALWLHHLPLLLQLTCSSHLGPLAIPSTWQASCSLRA